MTSIWTNKSPNTIWHLSGLRLIYDGRISSKLGRFLIVSTDGDAVLGRLTERPLPRAIYSCNVCGVSVYLTLRDRYQEGSRSEGANRIGQEKRLIFLNPSSKSEVCFYKRKWIYTDSKKNVRSNLMEDFW